MTVAKHAKGKTIDAMDGTLRSANSKRTEDRCPSAINRSNNLIARLIQRIIVKINKKKTKVKNNCFNI